MNSKGSLNLKRIMRLSRIILIIAVVCSLVVPLAVAMSMTAARHHHPQTTWAKPGHKPLSDKEAAAQVAHVPEVRPTNRPYNNYYPSAAQLHAFYTTTGGRYHKTSVQENPLNAYVTGHDHLKNPSTDDLIQWAAHKWGIPENVMRAQTSFESLWFQNWGGDLSTVSHADYWRYPAQFRESDWRVWQSIGIAQIKWVPGSSLGVGTEPLRWLSTAFNVDYLGATIRYYYDGRCRWCKPGYRSKQPWLSIGGWNRPQPWLNGRQWFYIGKVKSDLAHRAWLNFKTDQTFSPSLRRFWNNDRWNTQ